MSENEVRWPEGFTIEWLGTGSQKLRYCGYVIGKIMAEDSINGQSVWGVSIRRQDVTDEPLVFARYFFSHDAAVHHIIAMYYDLAPENNYEWDD